MIYIKISAAFLKANKNSNILNRFRGFCFSEKNRNLETNSIERLSDNILYAPNMQMVQDVTKNPQQQIADLKEV